MAPNPRRIEAKLQALYDQVPATECSGACHGACCFVPVSNHEKARMEQLTGKKFETVDAHEVDPVQRFGPDNRPLARYRCSMLTEDGRCSVYEDRPMVCRLFGAAEGIECFVAGCECKKPLKLADGMALLNESMRIGGPPSNYPAAALELESHALKLRLEEAAPDLRDVLGEIRQSNNERLMLGKKPKHGA